MSIILNPTMKEYQNPNLWEMVFYSVGRGNFDENEMDMRLLVQSTTLPFQKLETETRSTGSKHISGVQFVEEFSVEFNETEDLQVINYLQDWMDDIYDYKRKTFKSGFGYRHTKEALFSIQKYGLISDLRIPGVVPPAAAVVGAYEYSKVYRFTNILLTGIEDISWSYGENDKKTISANFTVDEIVQADSSRPQSLELSI